MGRATTDYLFLAEKFLYEFDKYKSVPPLTRTGTEVFDPNRGYREQRWLIKRAYQRLSTKAKDRAIIIWRQERIEKIHNAILGMEWVELL